MTDTLTLTGLVATTPRHVVTTEGLAISSFRLASAQRRFDRAQQRWIDADTNWYTITAFRQLGTNCAGSLAKGDRVVVTGRLRIREWESGERTGTTIEIEADAIGHDLFWGTSTFTRSIGSSSAAPDTFAQPAPHVSGMDAAQPETGGTASAPSSASESESVALPF